MDGFILINTEKNRKGQKCSDVYYLESSDVERTGKRRVSQRKVERHRNKRVNPRLKLREICSIRT